MRGRTQNAVRRNCWRRSGAEGTVAEEAAGSSEETVAEEVGGKGSAPGNRKVGGGSAVGRTRGRQHKTHPPAHRGRTQKTRGRRGRRVWLSRGVGWAHWGNTSGSRDRRRCPHIGWQQRRPLGGAPTSGQSQGSCLTRKGLGDDSSTAPDRVEKPGPGWVRRDHQAARSTYYLAAVVLPGLPHGPRGAAPVDRVVSTRGKRTRGRTRKRKRRRRRTRKRRRRHTRGRRNSDRLAWGRSWRKRGRKIKVPDMLMERLTAGKEREGSVRRAEDSN